MPRKSEKPSRKEIYRLWWEYLRRSENHRRWCEGYKKTSTYEIPSQDQKDKMKFVIPSLAWMDIFDKTFEEWWASFAFAKFLDIDIQDYSKSGWGLDFDLRMARSWLNQNENADPTIQNFIEQFKLNFATKELFTAVLSVNLLTDRSIEDLKKEFGDLIKKKREVAVREYKKFRSFGGTLLGQNPAWIYPTKPLRFDEVERYLKIYDLHQQGPEWRDVAAKIYPKKTFDSDLRSILIREGRKAQKIIENAEKGIFPGSY